ncbi:MAG: hypothetical protein K2N30_01010 [Clostridia bacterium]|nr:hypothetical protein [Clostridia bacterium]
MHEGHRARMYEKLKNDDGLLDHEVLEILLYNAYPRINTNPVSHALIKTFGSLSGVFSADVNSLMAVDGVGESVALYLKCVGECNKRISSKYAGIAVIKNHEDFKKFTTMRLRGNNVEVMEIYCVDKSGRVKRVNSFTDEKENNVEVGTDKVLSILSLEKPYGILVVHNHVRGGCAPSVNDDKFTAQVQLLCSISNVRLLDHMIYYTDKEIFSYLNSGRLDDIVAEFSFKAVIGEKLEKLMRGKKD